MVPPPAIRNTPQPWARPQSGTRPQPKRGTQPDCCARRCAACTRARTAGTSRRQLGTGFRIGSLRRIPRLSEAGPPHHSGVSDTMAPAAWFIPSVHVILLRCRQNKIHQATLQVDPAVDQAIDASPEARRLLPEGQPLPVPLFSPGQIRTRAHEAGRHHGNGRKRPPLLRQITEKNEIAHAAPAHVKPRLSLPEHLSPVKSRVRDTGAIEP